ncbi:HTH-type transcriptional regulator GltC [Jeotgalicoccus aerolatus]|uniref:DNA-binding transcriptional LysR family regulator n=1 Tax=Jeotgalicoccus aerolatus TaxID=709510 RepID=A0ABS4HL14_9STAP|nr:LysR family transcriptional regulator [Jeotgalicoccus aerolatus]MBP1951107.1 DNA-binding transcriptional LysR family regulator [Jeotgalicoccus aerolatus]GGE00208.1 HTH-type transcriptional regulator BsdA [Jeotgalicoccus aerolatus]CAD2078082.1 HTH-type transcriptional regulator GltC [Jeotgalicoccus aerolatus]
MDIRQLRYFIVIAEEKQISAAAKKLYMSQPPLSQQLKNMEASLGEQLFERSGKFLELTEAGKTLYKYAIQITQMMEEAKNEVADVGGGVDGRLAVGINTFSLGNLNEVFHQYRSMYPKIKYKIQQNESSLLCYLLKQREIEMAIVRLPLEIDEFTLQHLHSEPFYVITSKEKKLFTGDATLEEVSRYPLVLPSIEGLGVYYSIHEAFSKAKIQPEIIAEFSDLKLMMELVSTDFGVSIVPESLLHLYKEYPVHIHKIADSEQLSGDIGLIWLKDHRLSKAAQNFIDVLTANIDKGDIGLI